MWQSPPKHGSDERLMATEQADAVVVFGPSGDLASKTLFPALYALAERGTIAIPIVGVARRDWDLHRFVEHVRESIASRRAVDSETFSALAQRLKLVDGDLTSDATYDAL